MGDQKGRSAPCVALRMCGTPPLRMTKLRVVATVVISTPPRILLSMFKHCKPAWPLQVLRRLCACDISSARPANRYNTFGSTGPPSLPLFSFDPICRSHPLAREVNEAKWGGSLALAALGWR